MYLMSSMKVCKLLLPNRLTLELQSDDEHHGRDDENLQRRDEPEFPGASAEEGVVGDEEEHHEDGGLLREGGQPQQDPCERRNGSASRGRKSPRYTRKARSAKKIAWTSITAMLECAKNSVSNARRKAAKRDRVESRVTRQQMAKSMGMLAVPSRDHEEPPPEVVVPEERDPGRDETPWRGTGARGCSCPRRARISRR